jgi:hypothetical protein
VIEHRCEFVHLGAKLSSLTKYGWKLAGDGQPDYGSQRRGNDEAGAGGKPAAPWSRQLPEMYNFRVE